MQRHAARVILSALIGWVSTAAAAPLTVPYAGRLTDEHGAPRSGSLTLEVSFYRSATGGSPIGAAQTFADITLRDGIFELPLSFAPADFHALFADHADVWIEIKDLAAGGKLPRQRINAVPYANKVPIDGSTLSFDADGKLTVNAIATNQVSGLATALGAKVDTATLTSQLATKADAAATTSALTTKADAAHSHTLAGDVSGDVASTTVAKLQGVPVDATAPNTIGQVLKWDGSHWAPGPDDGGLAGAISNGSNLGAGSGIFKSVAAPNMEFRSLTAGSNVSLTTNANDIQIATTPTLTSSAQAGLVAAPFGTAAGNTGELRLQELAASGSNYVAFKAPDTLATDVTYTVPSAAPGSDGQVLSGSTAGALSWTSLPASLPPSGSAGGDLTGSYPNPDLAAGAVGTSELAADAVTSAKIAADTIVAADLAAGAVGTSELAADAVTSAKIQDGTIATADLTTGAVTTTEIADGTIANADINASAAIARSKLASGTASHVLINDGSGNLSSEAQLATARGGTGVASTATFPTAGVVVTEAATATLTNKTLDSTNTLTGATAASFTNGAATVTLPAATGTLATLAGTETLTNKTLTSPTINTPTISGGTMTSAAGSASAPSYAFSGDSNSGIWSAGADTVNLSTGGAERLRVDANGNIGIGTTNPTSVLDVNQQQNGDTSLHIINGDTTGTAASESVVLGSAAGGGTYGYLRYANAGNTSAGQTPASGLSLVAGTSAVGGLNLVVQNASAPIRFFVANHSTSDIVFDSTGSVGIGTTVPDAKLNIKNGGLSFTNASAYHYLDIATYSSASSSLTGTMKIVMPKSWSSTFMRIVIKGVNYVPGANRGAWEAVISGYDFSASVWHNYGAEIHGSAPFTQIRLGHDGTNDVILLGTTSTTWNYPKIVVADFLGSTPGWGSGWTIAPITDESGITSIVTPSIPMYLDQSGNVGIGTTSPAAKMDVAGEIKVGNSGLSCNGATAGAVRYNAGAVEYCSGTTWGSIGGASGGPPAGTVEAMLTSSCPTGYLAANGTAVSRATYATLFAAIGTNFGSGDGSTTFNLPDLRGYFLRGWDNGAGNDPDAASRTNRGDGTTGDSVGTKQSYSTASHTHGPGTLAGTTTSDGAHSHTIGFGTGGTGGFSLAAVNLGSLSTSSSGAHAHSVSISSGATAASGTNETRPKNVNVLYCVKN